MDARVSLGQATDGQEEEVDRGKRKGFIHIVVFSLLLLLLCLFVRRILPFTRFWTIERGCTVDWRRSQFAKNGRKSVDRYEMGKNDCRHGTKIARLKQTGRKEG